MWRGRHAGCPKPLCGILPCRSDALTDFQPDLPDVLAHNVQLARDGGLRLDVSPQVVIVPDATVALHKVVVLADHVEAPREATQVMQCSI